MANYYMIRVGRCTYNKAGKRIDPTYDGFIPIVVLMLSHSKYGTLGPYILKDDKNRIMENIWQFSKVYEKIPKSIQKYSRYDPKVIWSRDAETHVINDEIQPEYWAWRKAGMNNRYAVRYPVGYNYMHNCLYALAEDDPTTKLNYVDARKKIYIPTYCTLVKEEPEFLFLKQRLKSGTNLLIIEVDGPHSESLDYYMDKYEVNNDFIEQDTMLVTRGNITVMLNDDRHAFGHGYCLAMALLNMEDLINE
jgi:hypothetical protein